MKINRDNLLKFGFTEKEINNNTYFAKGNICVVYNYDTWIP